jgi:hypothetical protein
MPNCHAHPDRPGVGRTDPLAGPRFHCAECWRSVKAAPTMRAYATGLGPDAHAEAQEARQLDEDFRRGMKSTEERSIWK